MYVAKKLKSGFVVCFYRSEEKVNQDTDKTKKSTDKVRISTDKVRISTDKLNLSQEKIIEYTNSGTRNKILWE